MRDSVVGWGELERKGTVQQAAEAPCPLASTGSSSDNEEQMAPD